MRDTGPMARSGRAGPLDLAGRVRVVQAAYSDAQHDLDTILTRPTLFDPAHPATADLLHALRTCEQLPRDGGVLLVSWAAESAVGGLETAWQRARSEADQLGLSRFGVRDRRRMRRARRLLHQAQSDRGSVQLRQREFHRAENLLAGLVALPDPVRAEILEAVRKPSRIEGVIGDSGTGGAML
jgi:hypothetical protein